MCCCNVSQCFCGCTGTLKKGVLIWGCVDLGMQVFLFILPGVLFASLNNREFSEGMGYSYQNIAAIFADLCLILGVYINQYGFLYVWLIFFMIFIVLYFIAWIVYPILLFSVILISSLCNHSSANCNEVAGLTMLIVVVLGVFVYSIPVLYIYFWICVNSLLREMRDGPASVIPMVQQPQVFAIQSVPGGQPMMMGAPGGQPMMMAEPGGQPMMMAAPGGQPMMMAAPGY